MLDARAQQITPTQGRSMRHGAAASPAAGGGRGGTWCTNRSELPSSGAMKPAVHGMHELTFGPQAEGSKVGKRGWSRTRTVALGHVEPLDRACSVTQAARQQSVRQGWSRIVLA